MTITLTIKTDDGQDYVDMTRVTEAEFAHLLNEYNCGDKEGAIEEFRFDYGPDFNGLMEAVIEDTGIIERV